MAVADADAGADAGADVDAEDPDEVGRRIAAQWTSDPSAAGAGAQNDAGAAQPTDAAAADGDAACSAGGAGACTDDGATISEEEGRAGAGGIAAESAAQLSLLGKLTAFVSRLVRRRGPAVSQAGPSTGGARGGMERLDEQQQARYKQLETEVKDAAQLTRAEQSKLTQAESALTKLNKQLEQVRHFSASSLWRMALRPPHCGACLQAMIEKSLTLTTCNFTPLPIGKGSRAATHHVRCRTTARQTCLRACKTSASRR